MAAALALTCRVVPFSIAHSRSTHSRGMAPGLMRSPQDRAQILATAGGTIRAGPQHRGIPADKAIQSSAAGEPGLQFVPFLTSPPDFNNTPPVVRMIGPGLAQLY